MRAWCTLCHGLICLAPRRSHRTQQPGTRPAAAGLQQPQQPQQPVAGSAAAVLQTTSFFMNDGARTALTPVISPLLLALSEMQPGARPAVVAACCGLCRSATSRSINEALRITLTPLMSLLLLALSVPRAAAFMTGGALL